MMVFAQLTKSRFQAAYTHTASTNITTPMELHGGGGQGKGQPSRHLASRAAIRIAAEFITKQLSAKPVRFTLL